jgi:predicted DNA-binding protein (UPF0251 family)
LKIEIDLDEPDLAPLIIWLRMLKIVRIRHEFSRDFNAARAARRLDISRYTVYRSIARAA